MAILFNFPSTTNHLHPLQVENCGSNSRLVVDEDASTTSIARLVVGEDGHGKFRLERVKLYKPWGTKCFFKFEIIINVVLYFNTYAMSLRP